MEPAARPQRKDAARNRASLVDAAVRVFGSEGVQASVNTVARAAGVDVATLYRNFRTKDDLLVATLDAFLEPLTAASRDVLTSAAPGRALHDFVHAAVMIDVDNRGLFGSVATQDYETPARTYLRSRSVGIATPVVDQAHEDGTLRPDFDVVDVLSMIHMLVGVAVAQRSATDTRRYIDTVLRGMRP